MAGRIGEHVFWTVYRKHYVRVGLEDGRSRALIAEGLGISRKALNTAIDRLKLNKPEPESANG